MGCTLTATQHVDLPGGVDVTVYRQVMGGFATGISVVTALTGKGRPEGMTANSLTSVSLQPTLLAVCFSRESRTAAAIHETGAFVVSLLAEHQQALSVRFSADLQTDPFEDLKWGKTERGIPVLDDGLGHLECRLCEIYAGGDHVIVLGEVERCVARDGHPLIFFKGGYWRIDRSKEGE